MAKKIAYKLEGRKKTSEAFSFLAKIVEANYGPSKKKILANPSPNRPLIIEDVEEALKLIQVQDKLENTAIKSLLEAALKTKSETGGGLSTTIILAQVIFEEGLKQIALGTDSIQLKKELDSQVLRIEKKLKELAIPVKTKEDALKIAKTVSKNNKKVTSLISQAIDLVGEKGLISVEKTNNCDSTVFLKEGFYLPRGYLSPYFITDPKMMLSILETPRVFITDKKLTTAQEIVAILKLLPKKESSLFIVAAGLEKEALETVVLNNVKREFNICAIKTLQEKELLLDLATFSGSTICSSEAGDSLDKLDEKHLGRVKHIQVMSDRTMIIGENEPEKKSFMRKVALIKIGGKTQFEITNEKILIEKALKAIYVAQQDGMVSGGGNGFIQALNSLERTSCALNVLQKALQRPSEIISKLVRESKNPYLDDVFDPVNMSVKALQNAVSIASLLLSAEVIVI